MSQEPDDLDLLKTQRGVPQARPIGLSGQQLGEYRLLEQIGSGGMGQVYLARHELMGRTYAVKILPADLCRDPGFDAMTTRTPEIRIRISD